MEVAEKVFNAAFRESRRGNRRSRWRQHISDIDITKKKKSTSVLLWKAMTVTARFKKMYENRFE